MEPRRAREREQKSRSLGVECRDNEGHEIMERPFGNAVLAILGGLAISVRPMALRPSFAAGLPLARRPRTSSTKA
jgi:hypothetical protein